MLRHCPQFTHLPPSDVSIGNSSSMNWVLPSAPHMRVPGAAYQYLLMAAPVWQPQLFTNAPLAKMRRSIFESSVSCSHPLAELSITLLESNIKHALLEWPKYSK